MKNKRENEDIMVKLDRILGFCTNTKENIESIITKCNINHDYVNDNQLKEDLKVTSTNLNSIMNFIDPIFKHYLVLPCSIQNENCIILFI